MFREIQYNFGRNVLGPIFAQYCNEAVNHFRSFDQSKTVALFASRGGLRLRLIYEIFCSRTNQKSPLITKDFMISRAAIYRAVYFINPEEVLDLLEVEMFDKSIEEVLRFFCIQENVLLPTESVEIRFTKKNFSDLIANDENLKMTLNLISEKQYKLYSKYLRQTLGDVEVSVFCDTGLYGSTLRALIASKTIYNWTGMFLYRSNYNDLSQNHFKNLKGVLGEDDKFDHKIKNSVFLRYWHLIEDVLEPAVSSIEHYAEDHEGKVVEYPKLNKSKIYPQEIENLFKGILDYVSAISPNDVEKIEERYSLALNNYFKMLTRPSMSDVFALDVGLRSRDLGTNDHKITILNKGKTLNEKLNNVKNSLWKEGQCRIEFGFFADLFFIFYSLKLRLRIKL